MMEGIDGADFWIERAEGCGGNVGGDGALSGEYAEAFYVVAVFVGNENGLERVE